MTREQGTAFVNDDEVEILTTPTQTIAIYVRASAPTNVVRYSTVVSREGTAAWVYDDGGRGAAGFQGDAHDCVVRAIAIATGTPYLQVCDDLKTRIAAYGARRRDRVARSIQRKGQSPRNRIHRRIYEAYLASLGWMWTPTMAIGQGCTVHLSADELPRGRLIVRVSRHVVAVIDGVIHDTHDPARAGTRCVYGYYRKK